MSRDRAYVPRDGGMVGTVAVTCLPEPRLWLASSEGWMESVYQVEDTDRVLSLAEQMARENRLVLVQDQCLLDEVLRMVRRLIGHGTPPEGTTGEEPS